MELKSLGELITPEQYAAKYHGKVEIFTVRKQHMNADTSMTVTEVTFPIVEYTAEDRCFTVSVYPQLVTWVSERSKEYPSNPAQEWFGTSQTDIKHYDREDTFEALLRATAEEQTIYVRRHNNDRHTR